MNTEDKLNGKNLRRRNRKIVETEDMIFLIRKVTGMDFLQGTGQLPSGKTVDIQADVKELQKKIEKDILINPEVYFTTLLEMGTVSEDVILKPDGTVTLDLREEGKKFRTWSIKAVEADEEKHEILFSDLGDKSRVQIITELENFIGVKSSLVVDIDEKSESLVETLETRFPEGDSSSAGPDGEEIRKNSS